MRPVWERQTEILRKCLCLSCGVGQVWNTQSRLEISALMKSCVEELILQAEDWRLSVPFCQTEVILTSWDSCNKETLLACLGKVRRNSIALSFYYYVSLLLSLDQDRDANSGENKLFPRTSQQSQWVMPQGKETCVWASHSLHLKNIFRRNLTQRIDGIQHLYRQGSI